MTKHLGIICTFMFLPAFAVLIHDGAVAYLTQQPFRLSDIGYLWERHALNSLKNFRGFVGENLWMGIFVPIFKLPALPVFSAVAGLFYCVLFILQKTRRGPFRWKPEEGLSNNPDKPDFLRFRRRR